MMDTVEADDVKLIYGWGSKSIERPMTHQERTARKGPVTDLKLIIQSGCSWELRRQFFQRSCRGAGSDGQFE